MYRLQNTNICTLGVLYAGFLKRSVKIFKSLKDCWSADVGFPVTAQKRDSGPLSV